MLRYLAIADLKHSYDHRLERASNALMREGSGWHLVFEAHGLRVFTRTYFRQHLCHPIGTSGVVLGDLFERRGDPLDDTAAAPTRLSPGACQKLITSKGRDLITGYWGDYVGLVFDASATSLHVVRAPTGFLPCHYLRIGRATIFFSHVADVVSLRMAQPTPTDSYLYDRVFGGGQRRVAEPLSGVSTCLRGQCLQLSSTNQDVTWEPLCYWHPLTFEGAAHLIEDPDLAARTMRAAIRSAVHTRAAQYPGILHRLSGGLDSSIVLGCLKEAPSRPRLACYTYYWPGRSVDERPWAQLAARDAGCPCIEQPLDPSDFDLSSLPDIPLSSEPLSLLDLLHRHRNEYPLAKSQGAAALFCGEGGDSGFGRHSIAFCLVQYLQHHGFGKSTLSLARDIALSTHQTAWRILYKSLQYWLFGCNASAQRANSLLGMQLVNPAALEALSAERRYPHPWFGHLKDVPWSTIYQLGMLLYEADPLDDLTSHSNTPELISPLYDQPVVELLLRIPAYLHFESGRERGLARRAFASDVPSPILNRLWKDRVPGLAETLMERHMAVLRETLLDGVLMRKSLLNRQATEAALSTRSGKNSVLTGEIMQLLDLELWARNWESIPSLSADRRHPEPLVLSS